MKANRVAVLLIAFVMCPAFRAQDPALTGRLITAATVDALDTIDTKPWHALVEAEIFGAKGGNPTHGTIEVWQSGSDRRTLYIFGSSTMTEIVKDKSVYRTVPDPQFPKFAPFLLAKVLHAGPAIFQVKQIEPQLQQRNVDSLKLDCITRKPPANATSFSAPAYCLDAQDHLRALFNSQQTVLLDAPEEFLGHAVSRHVSITNSDVATATANITKLETYEPLADDFVQTADMKPFVPRARISGSVIAGLLVSKTDPVYPDAARSSHIAGAVVLHVIVGTNGHVQTVEVASATDDALAQSAIAVKQWVYKPFLLNGEPVEVETTITVNFALGSGSERNSGRRS